MKASNHVNLQDTGKPILLTMTHLARKLGVTKRTIARWIQAGAGAALGDLRSGIWIPRPDGALGRTCFWLKSKPLDRHLAKIKATLAQKKNVTVDFGVRRVWTTAEIAGYLGVSGKSIQRYVVTGQERKLWEPAFRDDPRLRWLPEPDHRKRVGYLWDDVPEFRKQLGVLKALISATRSVES